MVLKFYDNSCYARENDEQEVTYILKCNECGSGEITDIDYESEWIDASEVINITMECDKCKSTWQESNIKLEVVSYDDEPYEE